jgi:hypothetical protein
MRIRETRQREPRPALPNLERALVDMAATQAGAAGRRRSPQYLAPRFALGAALATLVVVLGLGLFGGSERVHPERASAADLEHVAALIPHLGLAGPWQITTTEVLPDGGRIDYRDEGVDHLFHPTEAEIRWSSTPIAARAKQLESEGFAFAGDVEGRFTRPEALANREFDKFDVRQTVRAFASGKGGEGDFLAAGLWQRGGTTFEYRATVLSITELRYLLERIELLGHEEWFIALQAGGGKWLAETAVGTVKKIEKIKVGQNPDGSPIYEEEALLGSPTGGKLDFESKLPIIYREGDRTRLVVEQPPQGLKQP